MIEEIGLIREVRTLLRERDEALAKIKELISERDSITRGALAQNRRLRKAAQRQRSCTCSCGECKNTARRALEPKP